MSGSMTNIGGHGNVDTDPGFKIGWPPGIDAEPGFFSIGAGSGG